MCLWGWGLTRIDKPIYGVYYTTFQKKLYLMIVDTKQNLGGFFGTLLKVGKKVSSKNSP